MIFNQMIRKPGMRIIRLLVENQLDGTLECRKGPGANFAIGWHIGKKAVKES